MKRRLVCIRFHIDGYFRARILYGWRENEKGYIPKEAAVL
jgi:hypothetical protein